MSKPCSDCGATLRFLRLDTGNSIPVNPVPDSTGNVAALLHGRQYVDAYVVSREKPLKPGYRLFRPHRADCTPTAERRPRPVITEPLF